MNIKKDLRIEMEEVLLLYYGGRRWELVSRGGYAKIVDLNNRLMEYLEKRGDSLGPMYFPRKENPKSTCGSCFARVIRNISWAYYRHCLAASDVLEVRKSLSTGEEVSVTDRALAVPMMLKKAEKNEQEAEAEESSDSTERG